MSVYSKEYTFTILCSHSNIEMWASDDLAGSAVTRTSTTTGTVGAASASINGTTDRNCNGQITVKGESLHRAMASGSYILRCGPQFECLYVTSQFLWITVSQHVNRGFESWCAWQFVHTHALFRCCVVVTLLTKGISRWLRLFSIAFVNVFSSMHLLSSACLTVCIDLRTADRILVEFDVGVFY